MTRKSTSSDQVSDRQCTGACGQLLPLQAFTRNQLAKSNAKCKACVALLLAETTRQNEVAARMKRCVQCFQDLPKDAFSKRQYHLMDGKCSTCVDELEQAATGGGGDPSGNPSSGKWNYDCYYRCCHRGKSGAGVSVRAKCNIASPIVGHIPFGRVFRATDIIYNEQGDPMVKLDTLVSVVGVSEDNLAKARVGWVPCRSIRNEVFVEPHSGPFTVSNTSSSNRFYRCVIEGCKARVAPDLELTEIGYVLYGDVVEVTGAIVSPEGVVFLQLHDRYFDEPAWVVERTLDNESVLNVVEGPSTAQEMYRCVQESGAPSRSEPSLAAIPMGRIPCGTVVTVVERVVTPQRQIFLRVDPRSLKKPKKKSNGDNPSDTNGGPIWVIETSTCCASVMIKVQPTLRL